MQCEHTHIYLVSSYPSLHMQYVVVEPYFVYIRNVSAFKLTNTDAVEERGVTALLVYNVQVNVSCH